MGVAWISQTQGAIALPRDAPAKTVRASRTLRNVWSLVRVTRQKHVQNKAPQTPRLMRSSITVTSDALREAVCQTLPNGLDEVHQGFDDCFDDPYPAVPNNGYAKGNWCHCSSSWDGLVVLKHLSRKPCQGACGHHKLEQKNCAVDTGLCVCR